MSALSSKCLEKSSGHVSVVEWTFNIAKEFSKF